MQSIYLVASRTLLFLLVFFVGAPLYAQITSNAFYTEPTQYGDGDTEDPVFFYTNINSAVLTAPSYSENYDFFWYSYSTSTGSFSTEVHTELNNSTSSISNIVENGYMVSIRNGAEVVDEFYCWNFVPAAQLDSIGTPFASCDNLRLTAYTKNKTLTYYKHKSDHTPLTVDYGFEWYSSPAGPINNETDFTSLIQAPTEDTEYSVAVGGKFAAGMQVAEATLAYQAIAVEAKFTFETEGTADNEATEGSAPLVVRFTDESAGKVSDWEWTFGDAGKDFVANPIFTFQKYAENGYPVVLIVRNTESECESETAPEVFTVNEMVVSAPNAFTPFSSPEQNDEFRVFYRSVKKFTMLIYNRWGRKVYQSSNPDAGWDGRIGSRKAEPGVYFYKIEAEGFNPKEKVNLDGVVHLIIN
ncbi:gliding motility-associated C-terminal domain-containing protein [Carboxylicivirga taeanensis]|uniref:T9SS type B sorting domain-containing protein n=1 Tax=Carboxylicivirga taeanensis TaxID=1416875 RepID=UPI003F6DCAF7